MFSSHMTSKIDPLLEKFVLFICNEYSIRPKKIEIAPLEEDGLLGLCIDESPNEFTILVKEGERNLGEIFTTVAHEMIHVKQHMKENLGWFLTHRSHIPYEERWWEVEAFGNAVALVEKFTQTLKV